MSASIFILQTWAAEPSLRKVVTDTLDGAVKFGFHVIRVWAFADGPGWNYLQTKPGQWLDRVECSN